MPILKLSQPPHPGGFREFFSIAYPLLISHASYTLMHFVDRLFLSWSSPEEIAACLPAGALSFSLMAVFLGISEYTNTFVAQYHGADRSASIGAATWQGIYFSLFGGLVCLLLLPAGIFFLEWMDHPATLLRFEKIYFVNLFAGAVFFLLKEALSSFYSGRGKTFVVMMINLAANVLNAVLDYVLIFGHWGFPRLGIQGAAWATVISTAFCSVVFLILFLSPQNHRLYRTRTANRLHPELMRRLLRFGSPAGVQFLLEVSSFTVFIFMIGNLGPVELAASTIALSINGLAWQPMIGASVATATLVGQHIGRKDPATAEKSAYTAMISVECYMLVWGVLYFAFPEFLYSLFQSETPSTDIPFSEVQRYGSTILMFVAVYQIADALNLTFNGALRGAGDTAFPMWTSISLAWLLFVPGTWLSINHLGMGIEAAWFWVTAYITLLGFILLIRFRSGKWKRFKVLPDEAV
ncbi:MAG TPA: MATE family efflux transporter [bacterium]|nr:MATE family efflux transporter [bacterium]